MGPAGPAGPTGPVVTETVAVPVPVVP
jgi:hypothetical protein